MPGLAALAAAALLVLLEAMAACAEEPRAPPPPEPTPAAPGGADSPPAPTRESGTEGPSEVHRPLGPNLFPLYTHELRVSDQTEILQILGLFRRSSRPDGSYSLLLLPFFFRKHSLSPPDERLYLFPLYYHRRGPGLSYDYLLPFYLDRETPESSFRMVPPFWIRLDTEENKLSRQYAFFPLFRWSDDRRLEDRTVTSARLGLWGLLELYESRSTRDTRDRTAFNFFNWKQETEGGLALYRSSWVERQPGVWHGRTHLLPLYWRGLDAGSSHLALVPLFGLWQEGETYDVALFPLLSRFGGGTQARRLDLLFPLFHYRSSLREFALASYPFFDHGTSPERSHLGILFWLYRSYHDRVRGETTRMVLFPLSYLWSSADGKRATRWVGPWIELAGEERRWLILAPLFLEREKLTDGEVESYFTLALPSYFSLGSPDDYFSMGFPLWWAARDGARGWQLFIPFYFRSYSPVSSQTHLIPLFSVRSLPTETQLFFGGPLTIHRRFYDLERRPAGWAHDFLWPLVGIERRRESYSYRFLPFFWTSQSASSSDLLLTPFYYQQTRPLGTFRYIFPFYAHRRDGRDERDFYAAGTFMTHRRLSEDGGVERSGVDLFWWLASFWEDRKQQVSHQHVLPLLFWRTAEREEHRTVAGPLYYSHRLVEPDRTYDLRLVLGTLYFSRTVSGSAAAAGSDSEGALRAGSRALGPGEEAAAPAGGQEYSQERGILWPLSRWHTTSQGTGSAWVLPFFYASRTENARTVALFPFHFGQKSEAGYDPSYFRYFFLWDLESWSSGWRFSLGQLLFDLKRDEQERSLRWRFLYPLLELETRGRRFGYQITPLVAGELSDEGGERSRRQRIFPFFWEGYRERLSAAGEWVEQARHFYLFPLFGFEGQPARVDYHLLYPFLHLQLAPSSTGVEIWPSFFYRRSPSLHAVRLWPLHAWESGEAAGDFWVSRYLFLSKSFRRADSSIFRIDPFLFRLQRSEESFGIGGLFELFAYDTAPGETAFRAIPLVFGRADETSATMAFIPFHYYEDFGREEIDYWSPLRFLFLTSLLRGADGQRHFSVLTKLYDHTDNPRRPGFSETRVLHRLYLNHRSESFRQFEINPFFQYYEDRERDLRSYSVLFSLWRTEVERGRTRHILLWGIEL